MAFQGTLDAADGGKSATIDLTETFWGYIIGPGDRARNRAATGEMVAIGASIFFGGAAFAQWLLPGQAGDFFLFKVGTTAVCFVLSLMLYSLAKKGLGTEAQVDIHQQMVRLVRRNRGDESVTLEHYHFDQISDALSVRRRGALPGRSLSLRLRGGKRFVKIGHGGREMVDRIAARINSDLERRDGDVVRPADMPGTTTAEAIRVAAAS